MKHLRLIVGTALILFIIGLFCGPFVLRLTSSMLGVEIIDANSWESIKPVLSFSFLLAFCAISAGVILWAYSQNRTTYSPKLIFAFGLIASFVSAFTGVWLNLFRLRTMSADLWAKLDISLSITLIDYFSWGLRSIFFACGMIVIVFLWAARQRGKRVDMTIFSKQVDTILVVCTIAIPLFAVVSLIGFLCRMLPSL